MAFAWLIERGQAQQQAPTVWWSDNTAIGWGGWTTDAWKARRYATKADADEVIAERFGPSPRHGLPASAVAVEHGFTFTVDAHAAALLRDDPPSEHDQLAHLVAVEIPALEKARDALERLVADLETNSEAGAPDYAHDALLPRAVEESQP